MLVTLREAFYNGAFRPDEQEHRVRVIRLTITKESKKVRLHLNFTEVGERRAFARLV